MMKQPVAAVTGRASGMGAATAELLLAEGYRVAIRSRGEARLVETAAQLCQDSTRLLYHAVDVGLRPQVEAWLNDVVGHLGRLDAVVKAHGVYRFCTSRRVGERS